MQYAGIMKSWMGKGYPDGLKAESISYFDKVTTISDIYDAMLSARSYKKEKIPFDVLQWFVTEGSKGIDQESSQYIYQKYGKSIQDNSRSSCQTAGKGAWNISH